MKKFYLSLAVCGTLATLPLGAGGVVVGLCSFNCVTAFSPNSDALSCLLESIRGAKKEILIAAYTFTSSEIAVELVKAKQRGVKIKMVLDYKTNHNKDFPCKWLKGHGIPIRFNDCYAIMHNKYMIIDSQTIETGSFNYTKSAQHRNAENLIILTAIQKDSKKLVIAYKKNFRKLWNQAKQ